MTQHFKNVDYKVFGTKKLNLEYTDIEELDLIDVFTSFSAVVGIDIKLVMDALGFQNDIDEHLTHFIETINQMELIKSHFDFSLQLLNTQSAEEVAVLKENYPTITKHYTKLLVKEDFAQIPMKYLLATFHDRYLIDFRYIAKRGFTVDRDGDITFIRSSDILNRTRILNAHLEMGISHYPLVANFCRDDIFIHPKSSELWQDIFQVVTVKQILTKAQIDFNFQFLYNAVRIAGILLTKHREIKDKSTLTSTIYTLFKDLAYYGTNLSEAEIGAHLTQIKPKMENCFQVWKLPDSYLLATACSLKDPIIGCDKVIYLPRLFPIITTEVILKEYADNTFNKVTPMKALQNGAPDLSSARDEVIQEIITNEPGRIPVRILAPENIEIDPEESNTLRGIANSARKLWFDGFKTGKLREKEDINRGIIIHIHGGGFVSSSSAGHRPYLNTWVRDLNLIHFSIDYRLAPEHQYPAGLDDCWQAYLWILNYAETILGIKAEKIILVGDSAGGNICTALTLRLIKAGLRAPDGCLLIYPCLYVDAESHSPSYFTSIKNPLLPTALLKMVAYAYVPEGFKNTEDPFISPICASDELLEKMPPIRIVAGSDDPLYDDNYRLIHKLKKLNRNVEMIVHKDFPHAFYSHPALKNFDKILIEAKDLIRDLLILKH